MKLSHAIRLGATLRPQAFGRFYHRGGTCALGAALEAVGWKIWKANGGDWFTGAADDVQALMVLFGDQMRIMVNECPACTRVERATLGSLIEHLNDGHQWSREKIADFVELYELSIETEDACLHQNL